MSEADARTARLVALLIERGLSVAVAESLTGGGVTAELVTVPGVSAALRGGVVSYDTAIKHSVLGVDAGLLAENGPVHPEVARQMARGVRSVLAVDGRDADVGLATTGVAGPGPADGHPAGTVWIGVSLGEREFAEQVRLEGDRSAVREGAVRAVIALATRLLDADEPSAGSVRAVSPLDVVRPE
jgi:nicotinamide-nucleotide amidase